MHAVKNVWSRVHKPASQAHCAAAGDAWAIPIRLVDVKNAKVSHTCVAWLMRGCASKFAIGPARGGRGAAPARRHRAIKILKSLAVILKVS